jgi:hypothetical protein
MNKNFMAVKLRKNKHTCVCRLKTKAYFRRPVVNIFARMAELVDALVSNTSVSNNVSVRPRLRVQKQSVNESGSKHSVLFFLHSHS